MNAEDRLVVEVTEIFGEVGVSAAHLQTVIEQAIADAGLGEHALFTFSIDRK